MRSTQSVNVREQPDLKSPVIVSLRNGRVVAVDKVLGAWVLITLDNGRKGYVKAAFLEIGPARAGRSGANATDRLSVPPATPSATPAVHDAADADRNAGRSTGGCTGKRPRTERINLWARVRAMCCNTK